MSKLISKNTCVFSSGEIIMNINDEANRQKKLGQKVINGSIGMLFDEEGNLASFDVVDQYLKENITEQSKKYDSITGSVEYENAIKNWLFDGIDLSNIQINVTATMGATGALSAIAKCYVSNDEELIVPSIRWSNYDSIALETGSHIATYNLISNNSFDIESFKQVVKKSCEKYNKAVVLINDPCQNPTGYSMSDKEWDEVLDFCKDMSKNYGIVLVDDIAYVNFKEEPYTSVLQKFVDAANDNLLITICFSASKSLQVYGLRGGALISLSTSKDVAVEFVDATKTYCRSIWSSPNHLVTNVMTYVFEEKVARNELLDGLKKYRDMLKERGDIFIQEAEECGLKHYPYLGGFFILVKCTKNKEASDKLMKRGIFVVPMCGGLRISIASISKNDIKGLAKNIKECSM